MLSIRPPRRTVRSVRTVAILVLAASSWILPLTDLYAAPRGESHGGDRPERRVMRVMRQSFPVWSFLVSLWEEAGLRIDDNG
jgi:hypothetical protein